MKTKKPLILVDGSSYLYRAFHALPSLANSQGSPTGAIYGMVNMLKKLINDHQPDYMAVIFDAKGKTFRDTMYPAYKANRAAMPSELSQQIPHIHEIIHALGLPLIMIEGVEADDVIGTLAKQATEQKIDVLVSTSDKDLAQLVNEHISLVNTVSGNVLNPKTVVEKFGVPANLIIDYLALMGDPVDNIPGVPLVGPKTAAKWLQEYGSLDKLIERADQISGKAGENLRSALSELPLSKQLVTIKCDVDLPLNILDLKKADSDKTKLIKYFQELEFKTWLSELLAENTTSQQQKHQHYQILGSMEDFESYLEKLAASRVFALTVETKIPKLMDSDLIALAFAINPGEAVYIPLKHDYLSVPKQLEFGSVLAKLKPILENKNIHKIGHDLKYVVEVLALNGIHLQGITQDILLEDYILDSSNNKHDIVSLALKYLGWRTILFDEIAGKASKQISFDQIPLESAALYASEKVDVILQLHAILWPKILASENLKKVFCDIEMPLVTVISQIEQQGVLIDADKLTLQNQELERKLDVLTVDAFKLAQGEFNLNSPKQLQEILFDRLKLPVLQKTPKGQPSTAEAVLQELSYDFPLPKLIMEHRALSKLISTYTSRLPDQINPRTQRVHTSYNQAGAATGRLSSSDPNLQNIPIRTAEGRKIRQAFIAPKGYQIMSADYSQIELRIMAHISEDPALLRAFEQNLDIHIATAAEVLSVPLDQVSSEERRRAKAINFGLIYGMSAFGLAKQLGIERDAAQAYINLYFERYPKVKAYMENTRKLAHERGFVETLWGRRLYIPDINSSQIVRQKAAERAAINAPLQGSAADIIKMAMIQVSKWLDENEVTAKVIMQVHDELVLEVGEQDIEQVKQGILQQMMEAASLRVPLVVAVGVGSNWDEAAQR